MALKYTQHTVMGINCPVLQGSYINSEEAIVFIHGFPGNADHWQPFMKILADFSRVVTLNMPGFGNADKPKKINYTVRRTNLY
jgi:pimeloyl-ACP methyl ester carboxylesterase